MTRRQPRRQPLAARVQNAGHWRIWYTPWGRLKKQAKRRSVHRERQQVRTELRRSHGEPGDQRGEKL